MKKKVLMLVNSGFALDEHDQRQIIQGVQFGLIDDEPELVDALQEIHNLILISFGFMGGEPLELDASDILQYI